MQEPIERTLLDLPVRHVGLERFLPFVMAAAQGLPETLALAYVRQACIDFATKSSVLKRRRSFLLQPQVREYPIWPDECEQVVRVNEMRLGNMPYRGSRDTFIFPHFTTRFTIRDGLLVLSRVPYRDQYRWNPQDDWRYTIEVRFCVMPTQDACEVDDLLYTDWRRAIEDGALADIYQLPGYQFTAQPLSEKRRAAFNEQIRRARVQAMRSDQSDTLTAIMRRIV